MKLHSISLSLLTVVFFTGCLDSGVSSSDYSTTYLDNTTYLVGHKTLDGGLASEILELLVYDEQIFTFQDLVENEDKKIVSCNKTSLEEKWTWSEAFGEYGIRGFGDGRWSSSSSVIGGRLFANERNVAYTINARNGQSIRQESYDSNFGALYGERDFFATMSFENDFRAYVHLGTFEDLSTSIIDSVITELPLRSNVNSPMCFTHEEREYAAYVTGTWLAGNPIETYWLNLYDIDRGEKVWKSDSIPVVLPGGNMGNRIRYSNGKLILANNMLYAYNVEDGTLAWSQDYGNSFILSSHPIVAEGRVYANNDSGFMVCLDVETGRQIWRTDTGGSPSPIVHHDGRIYMSNVTQPGGNSLLVIDADTGEILYDVVAPYDPDVDPSPLFNDAIAVDPETGYVYAGNYRDLLVYDFP